MTQIEKPNPEKRSNGAMIVFCTGLGLCALAWFLGVSTAFTAAFTGGLSGAATGFIGGIALILSVCVGVVLMLVGTVWIVIQVLADQTTTRDRYRDVQR
jgi:hypothetical protein